MALSITKNVIILDASCLVNLYATAHMAEILRSVPQSITVAAYVFNREALWIKEDVNGKMEKQPVQLQPLVDAGLLTLVSIKGETESNLHVLLSSKIRDEGESQTGAIAIHRDWAIAIDDRKARRIIRETGNNIELIYSLQLVKHWVETEKMEDVIIREMLVLS
ncbi:MAG: hypothetical protein H6658_04925 [Ardenticatenaceae bacterium]|nr:hypothetical protein [Ardenticatenaceae bacterium]